MWGGNLIVGVEIKITCAGLIECACHFNNHCGCTTKRIDKGEVSCCRGVVKVPVHYKTCDVPGCNVHSRVVVAYKARVGRVAIIKIASNGDT